jgi:hypothetical protein
MDIKKQIEEDQIQALSNQYSHVAEEHISRLVESCILSGWDIDLAEQKYLARTNNEIETPVEMLDIFKDMVEKERYR